MSYGFVAYIDESGDDGLNRVKPRDPNGSTEWFVLAALVVSADNERHVPIWKKNLSAELGLTQRTDIHFSDLKSDGKKRLTCLRISQQRQRSFVVLSNKKNIRRYYNPFPQYEKYWFYWWMTRLLLERVTEFCAAASEQLYGHARPVRLVFSRRGRMRYEHFIRYLQRLKESERKGRLVNKERAINWDLIDFNEVRVIAHKNSPGLQLADCVAGAFFQAVEHDKGGGCKPQYACLLKDRMYRRRYGDRHWFIGHGVKPMPDLRDKDMVISLAQRELFELYGFPKNGWG